VRLPKSKPWFAPEYHHWFVNGTENGIYSIGVFVDFVVSNDDKDFSFA